MRRWSRWATDETGSASLEFITAGLLLLVPLVYLVVAVASLQAAAFAAEGASRQAARVFVRAESTDDAHDQVRRAVEFALTDQGIDPAQASVVITCSPVRSDCLAAGSIVTVGVTVRVPMPLVPAALDLDSALAINVDSAAAQQVSRFGGNR